MRKKTLLFICIVMVSCQSRHKKLLNELDHEELKQTLMSSDYMAMEDSLSKNKTLLNDSVFMQRRFSLKIDNELQERHIKELKERIILEK